MELHKDHACVCIGCVCLLLMIMMIESLWNCCTRPNAARGTVLTVLFVFLGLGLSVMSF
jgi:hypothetical protein